MNNPGQKLGHIPFRRDSKIAGLSHCGTALSEKIFNHPRGIVPRWDILLADYQSFKNLLKIVLIVKINNQPSRAPAFSTLQNDLHSQ